MRGRKGDEPTYPLRAASRLTGLSPEVLRAWERRYGVVEPMRTPGGTRRYTAGDLARLRRVKAAVDAGHRISAVAQLDDSELERRSLPAAPTETSGAEAIFTALDRLDATEAQRLFSLELASRGPVRFAREFALPLVHEIGERWADERMTIASEHLASGVLRNLFGTALSPSAASRLGPKIVFTTPSGERHELGLQIAALAAMGAGANPIYLGAELPVESILGAVERSGAAVLALSVVTISGGVASRMVRSVRAGLDDGVHIWVGGAASADLDPIDGVERIVDLGELERRVALLAFE
jgi:DNA-binding transcriptional MerR regulator